MSDLIAFYNTVINQDEMNPYKLLTEASLEDIQLEDLPGWAGW